MRITKQEFIDIIGFYKQMELKSKESEDILAEGYILSFYGVY